MRENKGQKNFKYGHFYRNVKFFNFTVFTMGFILDADRGLGLAKLIFVWQKKTSNSIQKLFMMKRALYGFVCLFVCLIYLISVW